MAGCLNQVNHNCYSCDDDYIISNSVCYTCPTGYRPNGNQKKCVPDRGNGNGHW